MKRKIVLIMALMLMFVSVYSICADVPKTDITFESVQPASQLALLLRSKIDHINDEIAQKTSNKGTGDIFYVDSNVTVEGAGKSWTGAKDTLDEAIVLCADNNGDIIFVAQGHAETFSTADATNSDSVDIDVIGVTIIGLGTGTDRPTFTYADVDNEIVIAALNVTIRNLVLQPGVANVVHAIEIEADADGSIIEFCEFLSGSTDAFEFVDAIEVTAAADDLVIRYNRVTETTAGAASWLDIAAGVVDNLAVYGNLIYGDYSTAVINSTGRAQTLLYLGYNVSTNLNAADYFFYMNAAGTGVIEFNRMYGATVTTTLDPGSCNCFENYVSGTTDLSAVLVPPVPAIATVTAGSADDILKKLYYTADGTGNYPSSVASESALSYIMSKHTTAAASTYVNTTDSLEAISDAIGDLTGMGLRGAVTTTTNTTTINSTELSGFGADFFNTGWYAIVTYDQGAAGAAPEGDVRDIVDYTDAGVFTVDPAFGGTMTSGDKVMIVRAEDMNFDSIADLGGSGRIVYVDSGVAGTADVGDLGDTWDLAYPTLTAALDGITDDNGDVIYIAAGHNEDISGAYAINDAGVKIIGIGEGDEQPQLEFSATGSQLDVSVSDVMFENICFLASTSNIVAGIDVADGGDGLYLKNCRFRSAAAADEFLIMINFQANADDIRIEGCEFLTPGAAATEGIYFAGVTDNFQFINNYMQGDWTVSAMWSGAINTLSLIKDNVIFQDTATQHCIEFATTATGTIVGNKLYSDVYTSMLDPGSMICIDNWGTDVLDQQSIQIPLSAETSDVGEVADGSNLERLEFLQNKTDDILAGIRMTGGSVGDTWFVDSISGGASGDATSWATAETSLKDAYDKAAASVGDIVFVSPAHAETISGATAIDTIGVSIIGLSEGPDMPIITMNHADASFDVTGNITLIRGIEFYSTTDESTIAIDVDAGNFIIEDCLFTDTGNFEHTITIDLGATAENATIRRCMFESHSAANAATEAIHNTGGVINRLIIEDCTFFGTWSNAAIYSTQVNTNCLIQNNNITNNSSGKECIELTAAMTGILRNNTLAGDTYGGILDPGSMRCFGNMQSIGIDAAAEDIPLVAGKSYARAMLTGDLNANDELFVVSGSPIIVTSFVGKCTVACGGTTTLNIQVDATDAYDYDLSTDVDVDTVDAGGLIAFSSAMAESVTTVQAVGTSGSMGPDVHWWVEEGIIESDVSAGGSTGDMEWYMIFTPVESGCEVIPQ